MWNKMMQFLGLMDETANTDKRQDKTQEMESASDVISMQRKAAVVSLHTQKQVRLMLCEPQSFEEAQMIADHLRARRTVVLNLHKAQFDHALRIIDFLSGTIYALGGRMEKIGHQIFLCAPDNVDVQGAISDLLNNKPELSQMVSKSQMR
ncbi:cell division protein SepF [Effusibacillus lacus]|uniref:Cell division protein SepF n=1 Tax=Effusibacillus lacus TaxID=1348429 RepID=A0A292YQ01_9BACL|nr:cell division inhibitor SepF [Effusibacillus lacus]GAX90991.1 cell division protein SepF [Effusibacillus lacus]